MAMPQAQPAESLELNSIQRVIHSQIAAESFEVGTCCIMSDGQSVRNRVAEYVLLSIFRILLRKPSVVGSDRPRNHVELILVQQLAGNRQPVCFLREAGHDRLDRGGM